jgi:hypothetical protein
MKNLFCSNETKKNIALKNETKKVELSREANNECCKQMIKAIEISLKASKGNKWQTTKSSHFIDDANNDYTICNAKHCTQNRSDRMYQCCYCRNWYHQECLQFDESPKTTSMIFTCSNCKFDLSKK